MEAMHGPINFGQRNNWWGLLVEEFTPPIYGMNYHTPYYQTFFENHGFCIYFKQFSYARHINAPLPEKAPRKAKRLLNNSNYTFKPIDIEHLAAYDEDMRQVYNSARQDQKGLREMTRDQMQSMMKAILDEDLIVLGYHNN